MSGKADPLKSEGARMERKAIRAYLRRMIKEWYTEYDRELLNIILDWIDKRHKRYDAKKGGLGK
jgi:hypothetical protein